MSTTLFSPTASKIANFDKDFVPNMPEDLSKLILGNFSNISFCSIFCTGLAQTMNYYLTGIIMLVFSKTLRDHLFAFLSQNDAAVTGLVSVAKVKPITNN
jgi:hypothetical protein